jgi:hypothetical protein
MIPTADRGVRGFSAILLIVSPAQAGIHLEIRPTSVMDSRLRGADN